MSISTSSKSYPRTSLSSESSPVEMNIDGIDEPVVHQYFETLNSGDFESTSELFEVGGTLQPPFDQAVVGREAIAAYLQTEATGICLLPEQGDLQSSKDGDIELLVTGKVQTPFFSVNVCWEFVLTPAKEISLAKVNLLASLQELLKLRQK